MLEEGLTRLYAEILAHLARAVRFFGEKSMGEFSTLDSSKFSSLPERLCCQGRISE
jgi:hypothetical protein